jgi:type II secretory pathway component PulK
MSVRDRGFALIIVLIAAAAVFALAMRAAVVSRGTTIEAHTLERVAQTEREAHAAVVLALRGLIPTNGREGLDNARRASGGGGLGEPSDEPEEDDDGPPELPPELIELLDGMLDEVEEERERQAEEQRRAQRAARDRGINSSSAVSAFDVIGELGFPEEPLSVRLETRDYAITLSDAGAVIDINRADERQLTAYFRALEMNAFDAMVLAQQVLDWIDEDDQPREQGAERSAYVGRGVTPRNDAVTSLDELRFVPAMTDEVFAHVRRDFSTAARSRIHAGSASRAVLMSLPGMNADIAERIVRARRSGELTADALDRMIPATMDELRAKLTLGASSLIRAEVEARDAQTRQVLARYEGYAIFDDGSLADVVLHLAGR